MKSIFALEAPATIAVITDLRASGLMIERVGEDAYNVISKATGAVLERLTDSRGLTRLQVCIAYTLKTKGGAIENFTYTKPAHNGVIWASRN